MQGLDLGRRTDNSDPLVRRRLHPLLGVRVSPVFVRMIRVRRAHHAAHHPAGPTVICSSRCRLRKSCSSTVVSSWRWGGEPENNNPRPAGPAKRDVTSKRRHQGDLFLNPLVVTAPAHRVLGGFEFDALGVVAFAPRGAGDVPERRTLSTRAVCSNAFQVLRSE